VPNLESITANLPGTAPVSGGNWEWSHTAPGRSLPGERDFHSAKGLRSSVSSAAFGDAFARAAIVVCMHVL
jgi:hypothetical protein